jgi:hypothetical protein
MEAAGEHHEPAYFESYKCELSGETAYKMKRDYWKDREQQNFNHLPDLF